MAVTKEDLNYIRNLVREGSAISLDEDKAYLVESRLTPLARKEGFTTIGELVVELKTNRRTQLHQRVIEAMTTNETSFFRDITPFEVLKNFVLPQLITKRSSQRRLGIWCAAASSGQEPFTIAMIIRENFPQLASWNIDFVASDISEEMLERCRAGRFSQLEVNRGLPAAYMVKYFTKEGLEWQLKDEIRRMIDFKKINLASPWPLLPALDIVFMRNVLIYFELETKRDILARLRRTMQPDGYLFLGGAETTINIDENFERVQLERSGCYQLRPSL
jgi:chemotaxis protein methyltransferase CheR